MRSFVAYSLLASATFASALERRWDYPSAVPALERRQEPGTPRYACHEDCGLLITLGREEGFCDNAEWNERYGRCMICANTFEIWIYYRNGVTSAAEQCGLSPTPSPSGFTASSTVVEAEESTTAVAEVTTTAAPEITTTAVEAEETSTAAAETTEAEATSAAGEPTDAETSAAAGETTAANVPTTLSTAAIESKSSSSETAGESAAETDSAATSTSGGSIGTIGVTPTPGSSTPSTVPVNGAAKNFGFGAAIGAAALAMAAVY